MFGRNAKEVRSVFNATLLKTFGKLSQPDIERIDGRPERLTAELVEQYGWDQEFARQKTDMFELKLPIRPVMSIRRLLAGVGG